MIVGIVIAAAGLLAAVAAVLMRNKLTKAWFASVIAAGVLMACIGGGFGYSSWQQTQKDKHSVYMALHYLEYQQTSQASYYLKKVSKDTFASVAAETILEVVRNNPVLVQLKRDGLKNLARNDAQLSLCTKLNALNSSDYDAQSMILSAVRDELKLSDARKNQADAQFMAESGMYLDTDVDMTAALDEKELLRQQVNNQLQTRSYSGAVANAARLVELSASAENRLLLAGTVAESVYSGYTLDGYEFVTDGEQQTQTAWEEREKLQLRLDAVNTELAGTQGLLDNATDQETIRQLTEEKNKLAEEQAQLQKQNDYLFVERAFSSIADLHSLDAAVVRARLHFATRDYERAVETLQKAANSVAARITPDTSLRLALKQLNETYNTSDAVGAQSTEFRDSLSTVLSAGALDLVGVSSSPMTQDFAQYIVSEQKTYGQDLYASGLDLSEYPKVSILLSGRDVAINAIRKGGSGVVLRDTGADVEYTVEELDGENNNSNICCVVDISGSMGGQPIQDLRAALTGFIAALDKDTTLGIVRFDDSASVLTEMGTSLAASEAAVPQLQDRGGTNISAGIELGVEQLSGCAGQRTMLLMTDGQSGINYQVLEDAAANGVVIHAIGFGGVNDDLLQQVADATGGQYIRADSSSELINVYLSLVGMIGNQIRVTYTVPEPEKTVRYFFVDTGDASLRVDYVRPGQDLQLPVLHQVRDSFYSEVEVTSARDAGREMTFYLYGENLDKVTNVTIGGVEATLPDRWDETNVRVTIAPELAPGWQTIVLTDADGGTHTFEKMLVVGQVLNIRQFRLGGVNLRCGSAMLTPDGHLVLGDNVWLDDHKEDTGVQTLALEVQGLVYLPVDMAAVQAASDANTGERYDLGNMGVLQGTGYAQIGYQDAGYDSNVTNRLAAGAFQLDCTETQARLVQKMEEGA